MLPDDASAPAADSATPFGWEMVLHVHDLGELCWLLWGDEASPVRREVCQSRLPTFSLPRLLDHSFVTRPSLKELVWTTYEDWPCVGEKGAAYTIANAFPGLSLQGVLVKTTK